VDVEVRGDGLAAASVVARLSAEGVAVRWVAEAAPSLLPEALGLVVPTTLEHFHRLEGALGAAVALDLCVFLRASARAVPGRFRPEGLVLAGGGRDATALAPSAESAKRLGFGVREDARGVRLAEGGVADLRPVQQFAPVAPTSISGPSELVVHAPRAAAVGEAGLGDKLFPVRCTRLVFSEVETMAIPVLAGELSTRWFSAGPCLVAEGARWASPHLEVGEIAAVADPRVVDALARLTGDRFPGAIRTGEVACWPCAVSCDGLPIVGPIPGRPRESVVAGLGECPLAWLDGLTRALVDGLLGRESRLPRVLSTSRFR
jgi:hypothetical protein